MLAKTLRQFVYFNKLFFFNINNIKEDYKEENYYV